MYIVYIYTLLYINRESESQKGRGKDRDTDLKRERKIGKAREIQGQKERKEEMQIKGEREDSPLT